MVVAVACFQYARAHTHTHTHTHTHAHTHTHTRLLVHRAGSPMHRFPDNEADIDRYLETTTRVMTLFPFWIAYKALPRIAWLRRWWWGVFLSGTWESLAGRTAEDVTNEITANTRLRSLLSGLWIDTGCPPDRASFFIGASVFRGLAMEG
jgi:hypothetical protein